MRSLALCDLASQGKNSSVQMPRQAARSRQSQVIAISPRLRGCACIRSITHPPWRRLRADRA
ncbi:MAG: hypothetical protein ACREJ1_10795, partial [Candidatus Methylomirabilales bacterium]